MEKSRYIWLDSLRGFAIIMVILGHVIGGLGNVGGGENYWLRQVIYSFHMPLMFLISGFVTKKYCFDCDNVTKYFLSMIKKIFLGLYIPYLIWGYLFWFVKYFIYAGNSPTTLLEGINLFWNYTGWFPGWYLLTLIFVKILDLILQRFLPNLFHQGLIWILLYCVGGGINLYLIDVICDFGFFFFFGKALGQSQKWKKWDFKYLIVFVLGVILYFAGYDYYGKLLVSIGIGFILVFLFSKFCISNKVLSMIGENSMLPYVLHAYFTIPVRIFLNRLGCSQLFLYVVVETMAAVALSLFSLLIIQRTKWLNRVILMFYPTRKSL